MMKAGSVERSEVLRTLLQAVDLAELSLSNKVLA